MSEGKSIAGRPAQTVIEIPAGVDLGRLSLSSEEGFLLSRVGKGLKLVDLVAASGLAEEKAETLVKTLFSKGALQERGGAAASNVMTEAIDLPPERRKEILELETKADTADLFTLLGVPLGASAEVCKNAYYQLSMRLHPDRFYGKNLGPFKGRIDRLFRRLTEAQQTLTDRDKRTAYERSHPALFAQAKAAARDAEVHDDVRAEDRARRIAKHPYLAKAARIHDLLARSRKALAANQTAAALLDLEQLLRTDPTHAEGKKLLAEAQQKHEVVRGQGAYDEGLKQYSSGDSNAALRRFLEALEKAPTKELCQKGYSVALELSDVKNAKSFAQKWVDLEPRSAKARVALAEVMERLGLVKNAKREAEEALKLEPDNKAAKALFAKLKWM